MWSCQGPQGTTSGLPTNRDRISCRSACRITTARFATGIFGFGSWAKGSEELALGSVDVYHQPLVGFDVVIAGGRFPRPPGSRPSPVCHARPLRPSRSRCVIWLKAVDIQFVALVGHPISPSAD